MLVLGEDSEANLDLALLVIPSVSWSGKPQFPYSQR